MEIRIRERQGKTVDELLGPDDNIVLRCLDCQEFFLPREIHQLKCRVKDVENGIWTWSVIELCPACHPDPNAVLDNEQVHSSPLMIMTKAKFRETRLAEKWGVTPPQPKGNLLVLAN